MAGKTQPAIFELTFDGKTAELSHTELGVVEEGAPFIVRCITDESYSNDVYILKNGKNEVKQQEYYDESFKFQEDSGVYECSVSHSSGKDHLRQIRLSSKMSLNFPPCSDVNKFECSVNGAECAMVGDKPTCFCPPGLVGSRCDEVLVQGYPVSAVQAAAGMGGVFILAICIVASIMTLLFLKERKKARQYFNLYGKLPPINAYGEAYIPTNPYKKISTETMKDQKPQRNDNLRNAFRLPNGRPEMQISLDQHAHLPLVDRQKFPDPSVS